MSAPSRPPGPPPAGPAPRHRRAGTLAVTAGLVLVADLVSKYLVVAELMGRQPLRLLGGALYLTHARNSGAAWGFAGGATVLFTAVAVVVVLVIVRTAAKLRSLPWAICLGLILGGASGNLVDRLFRAPGPFRGHVVDWISVFDPYGRVFPIFNLADSGIVCGGILAVLLAMLGLEMDGSRSRNPDTGPPPTHGGPTPGPGSFGRNGPAGPGGPGPTGPAPAGPGPSVPGPSAPQSRTPRHARTAPPAGSPPHGYPAASGQHPPVRPGQAQGPRSRGPAPTGPPPGQTHDPRPGPSRGGYVPSARPLAGPGQTSPGPAPPGPDGPGPVADAGR